MLHKWPGIARPFRQLYCLQFQGGLVDNFSAIPEDDSREQYCLVDNFPWNCRQGLLTISPGIAGRACWQLPLELQAGSVDNCPWNCRQGWLTIALGIAGRVGWQLPWKSWQGWLTITSGIPGRAGWQSPLEFQAGLVDDRPCNSNLTKYGNS